MIPIIHLHYSLLLQNLTIHPMMVFVRCSPYFADYFLSVFCFLQPYHPTLYPQPLLHLPHFFHLFHFIHLRLSSNFIWHLSFSFYLQMLLIKSFQLQHLKFYHLPYLYSSSHLNSLLFPFLQLFSWPTHYPDSLLSQCYLLIISFCQINLKLKQWKICFSVYAPLFFYAARFHECSRYLKTLVRTFAFFIEGLTHFFMLFCYPQELQAIRNHCLLYFSLLVYSNFMEQPFRHWNNHYSYFVDFLNLNVSFYQLTVLFPVPLILLFTNPWPMFKVFSLDDLSKLFWSECFFILEQAWSTPHYCSDHEEIN